MSLNPVDSRYAMTGGVDGNLEYCDVFSGSIAAKLTGHTEAVTCCGFHPRDPLLFVSGSADRSMRIWKINRIFFSFFCSAKLGIG